MCQYQLLQQLYVISAGVEAIDVLVAFTAGFDKRVAIFHRDFFDGFETVSAESRADHLHRLDS